MLDGNAIAGTMTEIFGADMTTITAACAFCGGTGVLAETVVYLRAPGVVVRCRNCEGVLMVLVERRGTYCVDLQGIASLSER
jgi:hypothetical protein